MKRATVVIGAAFGDEGKGIMTDYFCRKAPEPPMVVRFNGGAQAGHTVVTPQGDRHVFHHYGAGTLAGARTYLSRYFLVNPVLWKAEYEELQGRGLRTRLFVDSEAPVTTVYDMLANQYVERGKGQTRHGSCGAGVHVTMERQKMAHQRLFAKDLQRSVCDQIERIREIYRGIPEIYSTDAVLEKFVRDCAAMAEQMNIVDSRMLAYHRSIVFEGAQGLLLDQDNKEFFPHVTHSKTGLHNVVKIAEEANIQQLDTFYVMRSYLTRHGAGPLPGEDPNLSYEDNTNAPNEWQGSLRFAPLDQNIVFNATADDLRPYRYGCNINITPQWVMTHFDQHEPVSTIWPLSHTTHGPTADDVAERYRR